MEDLRVKIQEIRNNDALDPKTKTALIQQLMKDCHGKAKKAADNMSLSCTHYSKHCSRFLFSCCGATDPCHRCHGDRGCTISPPQIATIQCNNCDKVQLPKASCEQCHQQFSTNFCAICLLWTTNPITHCEYCGLCRVGEPGSLFHCQNCDACYPTASQSSHRCGKIKFRDEKCSICLESLYTSQKPATVASCGHPAHDDCLNQSIRKHNFRCPICRKSLCDMSNEWNALRYSIARQPMPRHLVDAMNEIQVGDKVDSAYGLATVLDITTSTGRAGRESDEDEDDDEEEEEAEELTMYRCELSSWTLANGSHPLAVLSQASVCKDSRVSVLCVDCGASSKVEFHFLGLECAECGSFNTCK